jgi:hypothetical protein
VADETWSGEVWTDAHGFAAVTLPPGAERNVRIDVRALADGISSALVAEPGRRRFTVTTSEPHVKVAWRATARAFTREEA